MLRDYYKIYKPKTYLFEGTIQGEPYSNKSLQQVLKQALQKTGITKPVTLHWLRHSYATHLLEDGLDIVSIKELLGHSHIETTMVYLHIAKTGRKAPFCPLDNLYKVS